ncbi:hypothetical protein ACWEN3_43680, partial [Streptomyces sp. NPDC004561]
MPYPPPPRNMPSGPRRRSLIASAAGAALLTGCFHTQRAEYDTYYRWRQAEKEPCEHRRRDADPLQDGVDRA